MASAGDDFGYSVAVNGGEIVVGSPCHSISANSCTGAAYAFTGSGSSWTQAAEMNDPGQATDDEFGLPVAIASKSILIGALGENSSAGSVFVYTLQGAKKATIADPANTANDLFGFSIAAAGKKLVIGAPGTTGSKGAAYYFNQVRGGWVEEATLTASNGEGCSTTCSQPVGLIYGDYFGDSVALGKRVIAVGAPYASYPTPEPDSVGSGAAYVFTGSGSSWSQNSELSDPTEDAANAASPPDCNGFSNPCNAMDEFGYQVALVGTTVVAAAPYDSQGYPNNATGAAFILPKSGSSWPTSAPIKVVSSDGVVGDEFGTTGLVANGKHIVRHRHPVFVRRCIQREPLLLPGLILAWQRQPDRGEIRGPAAPAASSLGVPTPSGRRGRPATRPAPCRRGGADGTPEWRRRSPPPRPGAPGQRAARRRWPSTRRGRARPPARDSRRQ